jgi:hypothetical protein
LRGLLFEVTIDNEEAPNIRYFSKSHMIEMQNGLMEVISGLSRLPDIWQKCFSRCSNELCQLLLVLVTILKPLRKMV